MERLSRVIQRSVSGGIVLLLVAGVLAACLSKPFDPTPTLTPQPRPEASGSSPEAAGRTPGLPMTSSELVALLPDTIGDERAFKVAMDGEELLEGGSIVSIKPGFEDVIDELGAVPSDVSFALSSGGTAEATLVIMAFRVADAQTPQLESAFQTFWAPNATSDWQSASIGGKSVVAVADPDVPENTIFSYAVRDIIFYVSAPNEEHAATLLSPLP